MAFVAMKEAGYRKAKEDQTKGYSLYHASKARAKRKNLYHDLTIEHIEAIWPEDDRCPVFGIRLAKGDGRATDNSPSLDRIDNTKGYEVGNVAVISFRANTIKNSSSVEELMAIINYIQEYQT